MNYRPAQIEDVDTAGGFICGIKFHIEDFDWLTLEMALHFLEVLDAADE
jgi:hypothetical protein